MLHPRRFALLLRAHYLNLRHRCDACLTGAWHTLKPVQLLTLGFLSYIAVGVLLLSMPWAQKQHVHLIDNLFIVTSAISTTGLATVSVADSYSFFGQLVILALFQLGGIGYMTVSSFIILARGRALSDLRQGILKSEFTLPEGFDMHSFVRHVVAFTLLIETIGSAVLYREFCAMGIEQPLWSAIFHCVSAFATAGFSLYNDSLTRFADNGVVCFTIGVICYLGAIGFIVIQDAWRSLRHRAYHMTFTSKVIIVITAAIFLFATPVIYLTEPLIQHLPALHRFYAAAFQVMTASTTAGFNTIATAQLSHATLLLVIIAMILGASPSGTGGGIKTTTFSSLLAILLSTLRQRDRVTFLRHEIPLPRLLAAVASTALYLSMLTLGLFLLCLVQKQDFLALAFEAASALGTVGLSMDLTASLTALGKLIVTALMFVGRVGPLTVGLAFFHRSEVLTTRRHADLAV